MTWETLSNPGLLWFLAGLALLIAELFTPSLILMFFGIGAWIVTIVYLILGIGMPVQLFVFGASSLLLIILLRKKLKTVFLGDVSSRQKKGNSPEDSYGNEVLVTTRIDPGKPGKVEYKGALWDAESDEAIEANVRVKIVDRNSLRFKVTRL